MRPGFKAIGNGRFTSIDPLWEKYYGWTPYQYCGNNPLIAIDPGGLKVIFAGKEQDKKGLRFIISEAKKSPTFLKEYNQLVRMKQTVTFEFDSKVKVALPNGRIIRALTTVFDKPGENGKKEFVKSVTKLDPNNSMKQLIEDVGHESHHSFQAYTNPTEFHRKSEEDIHKDWDKQRLEKGDGVDPGAIKVGKTVEQEWEATMEVPVIEKSEFVPSYTPSLKK